MTDSMPLTLAQQRLGIHRLGRPEHPKAAIPAADPGVAAASAAVMLPVDLAELAPDPAPPPDAFPDPDPAPAAVADPPPEPEAAALTAPSRPPTADPPLAAIRELSAGIYDLGRRIQATALHLESLYDLWALPAEEYEAAHPAAAGPQPAAPLPGHRGMDLKTLLEFLGSSDILRLVADKVLAATRESSPR